MMRKFCFLLGLSLALASSGASQPPPEPEPAAYQNEPPADIPPLLLELRDQKEQLQGALEEIWDKLGARPPTPDPMGSRPMMPHPFERPIKARRLGHNHEILGELDQARRELDRVVREAWDTCDRLLDGGLPDFPPPPPENAKTIEYWMVRNFGPRPRDGPRHPFGHPPWAEMVKKNIAPRLERLILRLEQMEKRVAELEELANRQQEEIDHLREAVRTYEQNQPDQPEE